MDKREMSGSLMEPVLVHIASASERDLASHRQCNGKGQI
jgi:hypothetical protein